MTSDGEQDETNILLNQETIDYYDVDEAIKNSEDSSTNDMSYVLEPG